MRDKCHALVYNSDRMFHQGAGGLTMLKIVAVVASLVNPNQFGVFVSTTEYTAIACEAERPQFEARLSMIFEQRIPGGVQIKSSCKSQADIDALLDELKKQHPEVQSGRGA